MLLAPVRSPVRRISSTTSTASLPMDTLSAPDLRAAAAGAYICNLKTAGCTPCWLQRHCYSWLGTWYDACRAKVEQSRHLKYSEATSRALYAVPLASVKERMPPPTVSGTKMPSDARFRTCRHSERVLAVAPVQNLFLTCMATNISSALTVSST